MIGLFIYAVVVARFKSFSGWAGVLALALIVIRWSSAPPRTCCCWCPPACARRPTPWAPKWKVILHGDAARARAGVITGVLLAVARIAGETAPLLFTALNNQFWTSTWASRWPTCR